MHWGSSALTINHMTVVLFLNRGLEPLSRFFYLHRSLSVWGRRNPATPVALKCAFGKWGEQVSEYLWS